MLREVREGVPIKFKSIQERVAEATGVSLSSVRHIKNELQDIVSGKSVSFSIQHKERPRRSRKAAIDTFNEAVICHTMNDFYIVEKEANGQENSHKTEIFNQFRCQHDNSSKNSEKYGFQMAEDQQQ